MEPSQNVEYGSEETQPQPPPPPQPQYVESVEDVGRYYRAVLQHNRDTSGRMDTHRIEVCMSNIFKDFIICAYSSMCYKNIFFS